MSPLPAHFLEELRRTLPFEDGTAVQAGAGSAEGSTSGTGSTAGATPIVSYVWDMGDGTVLSGATVQHAYSSPGTFTYNLTVTDQGGQSSVASQSIQVQQVVETGRAIRSSETVRKQMACLARRCKAVEGAPWRARKTLEEARAA